MKPLRSTGEVFPFAETPTAEFCRAANPPYSGFTVAEEGIDWIACDNLQVTPEAAWEIFKAENPKPQTTGHTYFCRRLGPTQLLEALRIDVPWLVDRLDEGLEEEYGTEDHAVELCDGVRDALTSALEAFSERFTVAMDALGPEAIRLFEVACLTGHRAAGGRPEHPQKPGSV